MKKQEIIEEICSDEKCPSCILKDIVLHDAKYNGRLLIQVKCLEKFKYERSEKEKRDIGGAEAWRLWVDEGFAKKFADVWNEDRAFKQIYKEITETA
jgi:hypothetical protein